MVKKTFMWFGIIVAAVIAAAIFLGGNDDSTQPAPRKDEVNAAAASEAPAEPPVAISAKQLAVAYEENEVAANLKYKNRPLLVRGHIDSIEAGFGDQPYIVLGVGKAFALNRPQARLARGLENLAASLKKGQQVSLLCVGDSEVAGTPMLKSCRIQP